MVPLGAEDITAFGQTYLTDEEDGWMDGWMGWSGHWRLSLFFLFSFSFGTITIYTTHNNSINPRWAQYEAGGGVEGDRGGDN